MTSRIPPSQPVSPALGQAERPAALLVSPQRPAYKWWVAATVMLSAFLTVMNSATVNIALPPMMTAFGLSLDQAQWIITAYMIAGAVLIPTVGWLGNWLGNRNLFLLSLLVFVGGSVLCGLAWSGPALIAFRILQGMGAGPIMPMAMVFLNNAFPPQQRGLAMGLYGLGVSFGPAVGPVLGGYVTEYLNWRMVFYLNVPPGLLGLFLVMAVIPNTREAARRTLDLAGLLTMTVFLVSLLIAFSQGHRQGWDSPYIQRLFLAAGVAFVLFLVLELTHPDPLVDLRLYTNLAFAAVSLLILINAMSFWGTNFLQTILLQRLLDYTPAQAGYVILPGALSMMVTTLVAGRLVDKLDRRLIVLVGLTCFALASYWFSFLTLERPMSWITWMIVGRYLTIGLIFTPMNAASLMLLPPEKVRMGSGLINLLQQGIGGTAGVALITTLLQRRAAYHAHLLDEQQVFSSLSWPEVLVPLQDLVAQAGEVGSMVEVKAFALLHRHLTQQATVAAYQDCFLLVVALTVAVMPLVLFLRRQAPTA
ncbi:MAG: EmrB/QacA family drug resistance transporter [Candidatus Tectimicrobiota bacterium]|nr:MAG: EmrB/QacA family drug resistance transporter [Candidatus Tectomicrobia bacterium]